MSGILDTSSMDRPVEQKGWLRKNRIPLAVGGALVLLAIVAFPSIRRWATSEISVPMSRVRIATVERGDLVREVAVQGSVVAAFSPTLVSPARGIATVLVRAGAVVEAGTPLVLVASPEVESRLEQERSTLLSLQADLERQRVQAQQAALAANEGISILELEAEAARRALGREQLLREEGLTNAVQFEKAQDDVRVAEMKLEAARQQAGFSGDSFEFEVRDRRSRVERQRLVVEELGRQVDELALKAPVAGLVSRVEIDDRDSVNAGQALVTVVDLSAFEVEVPVPEAYADEVASGTPAVINYDGREWAGTVKSISPEVESARVPAIVVFDGESPENLKQNQRVSARIVMDTRRDVLKVARGPFLEAGGGRTAYVVADGVAELRPIEVGSLSVTEIEITAGLEAGDQIIISDPARFRNAERVLLRR